MLPLLPLIAVLTLAFFTISLLVAQHLRLRLAIFWLWAVLGETLAWLTIFFSRGSIPIYIPLGNWQLDIFSVASPSILTDHISWPFALALTTLGLAVTLTDVVSTVGLNPIIWAGNLALTALGLMAVLAGNPLTLALTWAAIDGLEICLLLSRLQHSADRERVIAVFSARFMGIFFLLVAEIVAQAQGRQLVFDRIPEFIGVYLLLASGLRLGVIPLHAPFWKEVSLRRGFGLISRMVPVASSAILLVRTATVGVLATQAPYLMVFITVAALFGGFAWISAEDELEGRPHWILGITSLSMATAVVGDWRGSLNWSMILILLGAVLFLLSVPSTHLRILAVIGVLFGTGVPFALIGHDRLMHGSTLGYGSIFLVVSHALLLAGYLLHTFRSRPNLNKLERWVWVVYSIGLILLVFSYGVFLWWWHDTVWPIRTRIGISQVVSWTLLTGLMALILVWRTRKGRLLENAGKILYPVFSFAWLYRILWGVYRWLERITRFISLVLEGEGGVLWAFLLLTLLLAFVTQSSP